MESLFFGFICIFIMIYFIHKVKKNKLIRNINDFLENFLNEYDYLYIYSEVETAINSNNFSHLEYKKIFCFCYIYTIANKIIPPHVGKSQIPEKTKNILTIIIEESSLFTNLYDNYRQMLTILKTDPYYTKKRIIKEEILSSNEFKTILIQSIEKIEK